MGVKGMNQNPYEIFQAECPDLAARFGDLIEAQKALKGLDAKTKQLITIAIQTADRNPKGVRIHAMMAIKEGATREEIVGAVVIFIIPVLLQSLIAFLQLLKGLKVNLKVNFENIEKKFKRINLKDKKCLFTENILKVA